MKYNLENEYFKVIANEYGGELNSIFCKNINLEMLWQPDGVYWSGQAPVLFPIVGALKDSKCIIDDNEYSMNQHGLARKLDFTLHGKDDNSITFLLKSSENTLKIYPYEFELYNTYVLDKDKLIIRNEVRNISSKEMYFSIGGHPAFNFDRYNDDIKFCINDTNVKYNLLSNGVISYKEYDLEFDSNNELTITNDLFKDDALIFRNIPFNMAKLINKTKGYSLEMELSDYNDFGLWSNNGAPFVCLEPWNGHADMEDSNHIFKDKAGIIKLEVNESRVFEYSIKIV